MPRHGDPAVYRIAERFVDAALRRDDSLFTPGKAIWSRPYFDELDERYVRNPDLSADSFEKKLAAQLAGASPEAHQLMAEVLYVYYLPAGFNISGQTKRNKIAEVLSVSVSAAKVRCNRARKMLKQRLADGQDDNGHGL